MRILCNNTCSKDGEDNCLEYFALIMYTDQLPEMIALSFLLRLEGSYFPYAY